MTEELEVQFELLPRSTLEAEMELVQRDEIEATFQLNVNTEGSDAKINGVNTLTLTAEDGIELIQIGDVATLSGAELKNGLSDEKEAREQADSTLQDNIDAEATARENADDTLQDNIDAEETARKDADEDLQDAIDTKQPIINDLDTIRSNAQAGKSASDTIATYGDIVTHDVDEFATAAQGSLADTALQPGDNVSELVNDSGYLTGIDSADVVGALGYTPYDSANPSGYISGIDSLMVTTALGYTPYNSSNPSNYQTGTQVANAVGVETTNRENADIALQQQIDAITASSDVKDIVGTHAELEDYDTSTLGNNDIIKVLQDETQNGATTYYRWNSTTQTFSLIGQEGPYYTKSEADTEFVPQTRTVNGKALSADITLSPSDIGAQPSGNYVTTDTAQDITATKAFKAPQKFQSGDAAGCITIGADVSATTVSSNTRKLGRMCFYTNEDPSLKCSFVSTDSQDVGGNVTNFVEFGGRSGDQLNTSPDIIQFTVATSHNSTTSKTTVAEYTASGAQFNSNNLAVIIANRTSNSGGSFIKYARKGTSLGHLGIAGTGVPAFSDASGTNNNVLVRCGATTAPAVGSATQPVYVDSDGKAVAITDMATTDTAQTISATKTYSARQDFSSNLSDKIYLKHGQMDITTTPSAKRSNTINFRDKNAVTMGYVTQQQDTDGSSKIRLVASTYETGTTNFNVAAFEVKAYKDGTLESYIDTPPVNSNDNNIANTAWVKSQNYVDTTALTTTLADYVTIAGDETITGSKTFTKAVTIQNGAGTGTLVFGANVNSSSVTNNTRKLGRINSPSYASGTAPTATLLGWDTQGDTGQDGMHTQNKATDVVAFGGMKKITTNTSPMNIVFCVTDTRGATAAANKIYPLEMDANEARFNVPPNYNGTNLATVNEVLPNTTKYGADLSYSSNTLRLLDQDGNNLGNSVSLPDPSLKANTGLDNLTSTGKNIGNWSSNVSNCITYIPQDIKLELNNGTLTLKEGSKVYVPNGFEEDGTTPKFDIKTIESDINSASFGTDGDVFQFIGSGSLFSRNNAQVFSGSTAPTSTQYMVWYDTTNNLIKSTSNSGSTWSAGGIPFPVSISSTVSSSYTEIKQIFNGFGYIGSTVFALPGVKGLIPNGRNADGTLKSIPFEFQKVYTFTESSTNNHFIFNYNLNTDSIGNTSVSEYIEWENVVRRTNNNNIVPICFLGTYKRSSGVISDFNIKTAFHALDYNDGDYISGLPMPSKKQITLTLGSSGTSYTAPANGWFWYLSGGMSMLQMRSYDKDENYLYNYQFGTTTQTNLIMGYAIYVPKGGHCNLYYTRASGATLYQWTFVYARGEIE